MFADDGSCELLQLQETRALESFEKHVDHWAYSWTCDRLTGFRVEVAPNSDGASFYLERNDMTVLGYTDCAAKKIVTANLDWLHNALTHELGHVIEDCLGPPILPVWHYGWESRKINAAVNNVTLIDP
jgi:hypothetical protein